ncbi:collagen alpha-1(XVII) chain-like [Phocoena sinus]|uniref:collagen alpha-1(XVII) chain-like n=1 Tax=Phocoena sinus TaxID=42100 RepID=UPI0013C468A6|nr:collagen alpha-1(XVII) chain-like [Phocoena sinus]
MTASQLESSSSNESKTSGRGKNGALLIRQPWPRGPPGASSVGPLGALRPWGPGAEPPFPVRGFCLSPGASRLGLQGVRQPRGLLGPRRPQASSSCESPRGARLGATALALRGCGVSGAASAREGRRGPRGRGGAEPEAGKRGRRPSPREPPVEVGRRVRRTEGRKLRRCLLRCLFACLLGSVPPPRREGKMSAARGFLEMITSRSSVDEINKPRERKNVYESLRTKARWLSCI